MTHLTNRKTPEIRAAIRTQFAEIISQEYEVETIAVDGEGAIAKLREEFEEAGYQVNTSGPKQHVPEVERKIGTLNGRIRSIHHSLAWQLTYTLLRYQVSYARLVLNMVPCTTRVDSTTAYEQFYGRKVNFKRHFRLGFGDYAEVHNNQPTTSNTRQPRALSCIALLPLMNQQGTYLFFSLKTRRVLKGDKWTSLPTPQWVADRMNALARSQTKPGYTIGDAQEDQPHVDDEDIINLAEPDEDDPEVANEGQEPPEDLKDWDNDMPERAEAMLNWRKRTMMSWGWPSKAEIQPSTKPMSRRMRRSRRSITATGREVAPEPSLP